MIFPRLYDQNEKNEKQEPSVHSLSTSCSFTSTACIKGDVRNFGFLQTKALQQMTKLIDKWGRGAKNMFLMKETKLRVSQRIKLPLYPVNRIPTYSFSLSSEIVLFPCLVLEGRRENWSSKWRKHFGEKIRKSLRVYFDFLQAPLGWITVDDRTKSLYRSLLKSTCQNAILTKNTRPILILTWRKHLSICRFGSTFKKIGNFMLSPIWWGYGKKDKLGWTILRLVGFVSDIIYRYGCWLVDNNNVLVLMNDLNAIPSHRNFMSKVLHPKFSYPFPTLHFCKRENLRSNSFKYHLYQPQITKHHFQRYVC